METLAPLSHSYEGKSETVKSKHMTCSMGWLLPGGPTATCCNHSNMGCLSGHITLCFWSLAVLYPLGMACCFTVLSVVRRILNQNDSVCLFTWYTFIQLDILFKYFRLSTCLRVQWQRPTWESNLQDQLFYPLYYTASQSLAAICVSPAIGAVANTSINKTILTTHLLLCQPSRGKQEQGDIPPCLYCSSEGQWYWHFNCRTNELMLTAGRWGSNYLHQGVAHRKMAAFQRVTGDSGKCLWSLVAAAVFSPNVQAC